MKRIYCFIILFSFLVSLFLTDGKCSQFNEWDTEDFSRDTIKKFLKFSQDDDSLGFSTQKDVVVFLGNTGAGKSTLINFLSEKELVSNQKKQLNLVNENDPTAMKIGHNTSETSIPKMIKIGDLLFCDLPGFGDTRGSFKNLINAIYIKDIIENARSLRIVLTVGYDQITSDRGNSLNGILETTRNLFQGIQIEDLSCLIVTKSDDIDINSLTETLKSQASEATASWREKNKVGLMMKPEKRRETYPSMGSESLFKLIKDIHGVKIDSINISSIYPQSDEKRLKCFFEEEVNEIATSIIGDHSSKYNYYLSEEEKKNYYDLSLSSLKEKRIKLKNKESSLISQKNVLLKEKFFFNSYFMNEVKERFESSELTKFLKVIALNQYNIICNTNNIIETSKIDEIGKIQDLSLKIVNNIYTITSNITCINKEIGKLNRPPDTNHEPKKSKVTKPAFAVSNGNYRIWFNHEPKTCLEAFPRWMSRSGTLQFSKYDMANKDQIWFINHIKDNYYYIICNTVNREEKYLQAFPDYDLVGLDEGEKKCSDQRWYIEPSGKENGYYISCYTGSKGRRYLSGSASEHNENLYLGLKLTASIGQERITEWPEWWNWTLTKRA